jgi:Domain of unknown function (DUF4394)
MLPLKSFARLQRFSCSRTVPRITRIAATILFFVLLVNPLAAELIYGIANQAPGNALLSWDSASPGTIQSGVFITGLQPGETILGIDIRPATGELYALASPNRVYKLNPNTGVATPLNSLSPTDLNGFSFGFDFNPTVDRIRIVSETNRNLDANADFPNNLIIGTNLAYGPSDPNFGVDPNVVDAAYSNNHPGASSTQLYGIDTGLDILVTQAGNAGTLATVGPLGLNVSAAGGFDISGKTGIAYAAFLPAGASQSSLYSINLATGLATNLGSIDGGVVITALTVAAIPEPTSAILLTAGLLGACAVGRRRK